MIASDSIESLLHIERNRFDMQHGRSKQLYENGQQHYLYGAPSHWFRRWPGGFPIFAERAAGATIHCVDGHDYADFCLGDTGAMCGHGPEAVTRAVAEQLSHGATLMLPTPAADWVGQELARRFRLPYWGFTTSATDANRATIRIARMTTGRPKVLVFSGCYHGSVEEAHITISEGRVVMRNGIHPNEVDHDRVSKVVEFNDLEALENALRDQDVACVLAEPFMTNYGMVAPQPGFHKGLRDLTRRYGTRLIIDETHTLSSGPGGYTGAHDLDPDMLVLGKAVGGGIPVGLYGLSKTVAEAMWSAVPKVDPIEVRQSAHLGFGGTLAGSALQVAAVKSVFSNVLTEEAFSVMIDHASKMASELRLMFAKFQLPWFVAQLGARVEIMFASDPPQNAADVSRDRNGKLESLLHLFFLNRGVLITPFHTMLLMCPATTASEVDRFLSVTDEFCQAICANQTRGSQ